MDICRPKEQQGQYLLVTDTDQVIVLVHTLQTLLTTALPVDTITKYFLLPKK